MSRSNRAQPQSMYRLALLAVVLVTSFIGYLLYFGLGTKAVRTIVVIFRAYSYPHAITVVLLVAFFLFRKSFISWLKKRDLIVDAEKKQIILAQSPRGSGARRTSLMDSVSLLTSENIADGASSAASKSGKNNKSANDDTGEKNRGRSVAELLAEKTPKLANFLDNHYFNEILNNARGGLAAWKEHDFKTQLEIVLTYYSIEYTEIEFEKLHKTIFKSQSNVLRLIDESSTKSIPFKMLQTLYDETERKNKDFFSATNFDFNQWLSFLVGQNLVMPGTDELVRLSDKGRLYLFYVKSMNYDVDGCPGGSNL